MAKKKPRPEASENGPRFTTGMLIADALEADARAKEVFLSYGLPCHECVVSEHESIEDGCTPLGLKAAAVVERLNALPR